MTPIGHKIKSSQDFKFTVDFVNDKFLVYHADKLTNTLSLDGCKTITPAFGLLAGEEIKIVKCELI